jgi:hypothetical protein
VAVTREGTRLIVALVAAVLAAALLGACGGSSSSSTGSTASPESASQAEGGGSAKQSGSKGSKDHGPQADEGGSGEGSGAAVATPLHVSGGGSGQFRTKGGDNSIQNFGEEGDESELQQAAEALHGFYVARAKEDWPGACARLAKSMVQQLEQLATQSKQFKGRGCPPILKAFTRPLPSSARRESTAVDAGSLRHKGEQAFLIYYGAEKTVYAMPMQQEGSEWRVGALAGTPLD